MSDEKGYVMWSRGTIHSDIFIWKPAEWFKIWFYIVNRANFRDTKQFKRGEFFTSVDEISQNTGATVDQVKKCLRFLRKSEMIGTERSTRGMRVFILNYAKYQDPVTYTGTERSTREALEKHQRSTTIGEERKNDKNVIIYSSENKKLSTYKDFDRFRMNDGTTAIMRFGEWCADQDGHPKINRHGYPECPPNNK